MIEINLPVPPNMNNRLAVVGGRMIKSKPSRSYAKEVGMMCLGMKPMDGDLAMEITWYRSRATGDIDSRQKAILDALKGFAYHDDEQIKFLGIKIDDTQKSQPRCWVRVAPLPCWVLKPHWIEKNEKAND